MKTLLLLLLLPMLTFAQTWAPIGAKWYFSKFYDFHRNLEEYTLIESIGDTIIDGILSRHLTITNNWACSNTDSDVFIYQTIENEVYAKINNKFEFHMLYNFSAQIGDSWKFPIMFTPIYIDTLQYTVTNISTIKLNGHSKKILYCDLKFILGVFWYRIYKTQLIEGIGDIHYMFPWQAQICDEDYIFGLRCYEDNEIGLYHFDNNNKECDYTTETSKLDFNNDIIIFPNPFTNQLTFTLIDNDQTTVSLFDLLGQLVYKQTFSNSTTINTDQFGSNIYLYVLRGGKGILKTGKLVKF